MGTNELALNPNSFPGRSDEDILSTLVHEMCHNRQSSKGIPRGPAITTKSSLK
jgi:hypothetical protein